jgi:hypothetical protein
MKPNIRWTPENIGRLREILMRSPTPLVPSIASEMQTTVSSITTAMSRHRLTSQDLKVGNGGRTDYAKMTQRACLCCRRPFLAEHRANYICAACTREIAEVAA